MKTKCNLIQICLLCAATLQAVVAGFSVHAATITWTNTSGGNWSVANNWSPNQVPTNADVDVVLITTPGTYTVTLDISTVTIDYRDFYPTVTLGAGGGAAGVQTFAMTNVAFWFTNLLVNKGGVFKANGASVGDLGQTMIVDGGVLTSAGSSFQNTLILTNGAVVNATNTAFWVTVVQNGCVLNVVGGNAGHTFLGPVTIANGGLCNANAVGFIQDNGCLGCPYPSLTVAQGGTLNMAGNIATIYGIGITNAGTINITNAFIVMYLGGGQVLNQPGGVINFRGTGGITGAGVFINQGVVNEAIGTGGAISVSAFDNTLGTITNLSGTLSVSTFQTNLSGIYYAGPGATIQLNAINVTPGTPLVVSGPGRCQFTSGTLYLPSNWLPNLTLAGGYLELGPGFQGGAITNLALDGIALLSNSLPVTGTFAVTNSYLFGNVLVASGGILIATNANVQGAVTVGNGGLVTASRFGMASPVTVAMGGVMNLAGAINFYAPFTNAGTVNISNSVIGSSIGIINQAGGLMDFSGSGSSIIYNSGVEYFINRGNLRLNSPSGTNTINFLNLDLGQGTVTNLAGTAILRVFQTNLVGTYYAAAGAIIQFKNSNADIVNGYDFNIVTNFATPGTPFVLNGGGDFQFAGGNLYLPANVPPHLSLVGGVLKLGPNFQGGAITNLTLGAMTLTNTLPVKGTLTASNYSAAIYGNFTIANGGVFNDGAKTYGAVTVANGGLLTVVGAMVVGSGGSLTVANGGTLNMTAGFVFLSGPLTNAGNINVTNPPDSFYSVLYLINDGSASNKGGVINQASGRINLNGDSTEIVGSRDGYAYIVNQGRIAKSAGTDYSVLSVPFMTNSGAITVQSGIMGMGPFVSQAGGSLNVVLNSATNYGSFDISSNLVLAGAFNATLANGYVPTNGTTFNVLSYTSYSGNFGSLGLPAAVSWQSIYGSTNFTLVAGGGSGKPQFATFNRLGTNLVFNGAGGTPGSNYVVLASTNVALPLTSWAAVATNTFDGSGHFNYTNNMNPGKPRQFFILKLP